MLNGVVDTMVVFYLMIGVGAVGLLAKLISQFTIRRLVRASANMSKSTHKLIKLVRAKYEHACMIHETVENVDAFVEKYIYEYRVLGGRLHSWRQLGRQVIWFSGILGAVGAFAHYYVHGLCEQVIQYAGIGAAEMVLLYVLLQLTDEQYKINAAKIYMIDYLENVCALRYKKPKARQSEKEKINIISQEALAPTDERVVLAKEKDRSEEPELPIQIEGEPKTAEVGEGARQAIRRSMRERGADAEQPALKEEAIRQILEEFLA